MDVNHADLLKRLNEGRQRLAAVGKKLKEHFVGLDEIIDSILKHIEVWYCLPEIIQRPVIVCLWGMTGTGKTDLVRRLSDLLEFNDRYLEVQLTTKEGIYESSSSLENLMSTSNLDSGRPGMLLLDEIQRFRSLNSEGQEIFDYKFQDVWTLLSDGRFSARTNLKTKILDILYRSMYMMDMHDEDEPEIPTKEPVGGKKNTSKKKAIQRRPREYRTSYWEAQDIRQLLGLQEAVTEIMRWDYARIIEETEKRLQQKTTFTGRDYSRLLIFVSGNIDEAYSMADETADADWDADVFYEHSKRITFVDIKKALSRRFMPEQVARFGNTHVIYPSLGVASYREIAQRNLLRICDSIRAHTGVQVRYDDSIVDVVYRNGVFPAQGVRPLFSTISSMFESSLPYFVGVAMENGALFVDVRYDRIRKSFIGTLPSCIQEYAVYNHGDLDRIRDGQEEQDVYPVAVHEAGHAVVYGVLFGVSPTQIAVSLTRDEETGFTGIHRVSVNKNTALDKICTYLAGTVAEVQMLGEGHQGSGCYGDIKDATAVAAMLVRQCGMFDFTAATQNVHSASVSGGTIFSYDNLESSVIIEKMLEEQRTRALELLSQHRELLEHAAKILTERKIIMPQEFVDICKEHGVTVRVLAARKTLSRSVSKDIGKLLTPFKR